MEDPSRMRSQAAALVDELAAAHAEMARAQARRAALMLSFARLRANLDEHDLAEREEAGRPVHFRAGEFASTEIGLATTSSRYRVRRLTAMTERLQTDAPDAWDAWQAGDLDQGKAFRINKALLRLTRPASKALLNATVVDVGRCKTEELLGRWLNQFVVRVEPDQADERLHRSFDDRYVSVRPDIDGISFLSAAISAVDAAAVDRVLDALSASAGPDDPRTRAQRRADALVDVLLGRTANGCHVTWADDGDDHSHDDNDNNDDDDDDNDEGRPETGDDIFVDVSADEWYLPASAFRPDYRNEPPPDAPDEEFGRAGRAKVARCTNPDPVPAYPAVVGVIVSAQSLFGVTDRPGELADRSAEVSADGIRELAARPGTLFYRLLTDESGNLLDVTELGRFASAKLGFAVRFRDGTCQSPICTVAAHRCDLDHLVPIPAGPTSADNLGCKCRFEHRAKTHAGHGTNRPTNHTTEWTTPTGHVYTSTDDLLPVESTSRRFDSG